MPSTAKSVTEQASSVTTHHLMVFDSDPSKSTALSETLKTAGFRISPGGSLVKGRELLRRERPSLVVLSEDAFRAEPEGARLRMAAAELGIPLLVVVDDLGDPLSIADRLAEAEDWVSRSASGSELPARVARLLSRSSDRAPGRQVSSSRESAIVAPGDSQFFALVIHDLRTPLNVIGLSLRMISQSVPKGDPELEEDIRFVDENFRQIERMLAQLSDYYRLFENEGNLNVTPFDPRRLVDELLDARSGKAGAKASPIKIEIAADCPVEVDLDPLRARQAIQYALLNANASAASEPIQLTLRGGPNRWITELAIDKPAPPSVRSVDLDSQSFERLCGFAAERRGMDLAITAKITELFGGTSRLEVIDGKKTTIVIDWPARLARSSDDDLDTDG